MTFEECRRVAGRVALKHGAKLSHELVADIEEAIVEVVLDSALERKDQAAFTVEVKGI